MFSRMQIKTVLAVTLAALFVVAFAYQASAFPGSGGSALTYTGKIVSLDNDYRWITVQAAPENEMSFRLVNSAAVTECSGMSEHFRDLKVGDEVAISYFENGSSGFLASSIDLLPIGTTHC